MVLLGFDMFVFQTIGFNFSLERFCSFGFAKGPCMESLVFFFTEKKSHPSLCWRFAGEECSIRACSVSNMQHFCLSKFNFVSSTEKNATRLLVPFFCCLITVLYRWRGHSEVLGGSF